MKQSPLSFFDSAFAFTIGNEGMKFTNDPKDSGGPTKFGITLNTYRDFLKINVTPRDIETLTLTEAKTFYSQGFWSPLNCHKIVDAGVAIAIFDSAVLYGLPTGAQLAQTAVNLIDGGLALDGRIGPKTLLRLNQITRATFLENFVLLLMQRIERVVTENPKNEIYRKGWTYRADRLLTLNTNTTFNIQS